MPGSRPSLAWIVLVVVVATTGYVVARHKRDFYDFEVYRTAGARALHAEPLYRTEDLHYQYKYWPAFAFAMIPFALVDPEVGKVVWYALSVGLLALFIQRSIRALPDRELTVKALAWWTLLLTGKFIVKELVNGQTNLLLGVLVIAALVGARAGRPAAAGVLVGLAAFVKPYALLFVPWLAVTAGFAAFSATLVTLATGLLLPALAYGWTGNLQLLVDWSHTVGGTTPENLMLAENISFMTMWAKWIGPGSAASVLALVTTVLALAAAAGIWLLRRRVRQPDFLEVSVLLLLVPLISPQGWDYVLILGTPAFVCLVDRFHEQPAVWKLLTAGGIALTSFTVFDIVGRSAYHLLVDMSAVTVGAMLLVAVLARIRFRSLA